jgi:RNA polymerase sigma-70 factor (ECF subfamily)
MRKMVATLQARQRTEMDESLLARLVQGSDAAFNEIYRRYARYVATIGFRLLGDDTELDDVVQETFLEVSSSIEGLSDPKVFKGWLATIAVRCVIRRRTLRRRRRFLHEALSVVGIARSDPAVSRPVDELYEVLDHVPERERTPWLMHKVVGESLADTANICGVSLTTAKRRIAEAETRLRRTLDAE